jgi:hypothetical protein
MKHDGAKAALSGVVSAAVALTFATAFSTPVLTQQRRSDPSLPPNAEARARAEHQVTLDLEREALLRDSRSTNKSIDPKKLQALTAQIKQDFERLWIVNGELMAGASTTKTGPDYQYVLTRLTEVKSRAIRLQNTLSLPKPEVDEKVEKNEAARDREELRTMFSLLNSRIVGFVTNPYFRNPKVVDAELVSRASRDLARIIELSRSIRKSAERLSRVLEKSP